MRGNTNASLYCVNKAIPDGSNLYYASLFETAENKSILLTCHALLHELITIISECHDPGVARIKLKWWQDEIEGSLKQPTHHPVTQQLQQCGVMNKSIKQSLVGVIDRFNDFIFIQQTETLDEILALYESTAGEIWAQSYQLLKSADKNEFQTLFKLGGLIQYFECLQQPYHYITESRCIIPKNLIIGSALSKGSNMQSLQKTDFSVLIETLKLRFEKTRDTLKNNSKRIIYPSIMTALAIKTCNEILADGCNLFNRNISLTPLRKLYTAWHIRTLS